jgi:ElaB/YqjD/DUF883 family membrane-anchored ribosome-binding protein
MDQEPDLIRQDIEQTRESLTEKLEVLEHEVKETITEAKETVTGTIETAKQTVEDITSNVKETVQETVATVKRTFDLPYQVDQHPWGMMGGSMAAGFLAGYLLPATRRLDGWGQQIRRAATATDGAATQATPGYLNGHPSEPATAGGAGQSFFNKLLDQFAPEIDRVKEVAIGTMVGLLRDWVKQALPTSLAPKVEEVMNQTTSKLGGEPIRGPVLAEASTAGNASR